MQAEYPEGSLDAIWALLEKQQQKIEDQQQKIDELRHLNMHENAFTVVPNTGNHHVSRAGLLKAAAVPAGLSFPAKPLIPSKPAGFA